jgi:hypothetical protein
MTFFLGVSLFFVMARLVRAIHVKPQPEPVPIGVSFLRNAGEDNAGAVFCIDGDSKPDSRGLDRAITKNESPNTVMPRLDRGIQKPR